MQPQVQSPLLPLETEIAKLRLELDDFRRARMARATEIGYAHDMRTFRAFCARAKRPALPATPETLALFIADQLRSKKVATIYRYAAGIAFTHRREGWPSPVDDLVREVLRGARRTRSEPIRQMRPLTVAQLGQVSASLGWTPAAMRNRALLVLGLATALRRANLSRLRFEDVAFCGEGLILFVRHEKQDRRGDVRQVAAPYGKNELTCPVRTLRAWLDIRGWIPGPLFTQFRSGGRPTLEPLSPYAVWHIVKTAIGGIVDPRDYGPHSLRAGLITEAGVAGVNELTIAATSGHKSLDSLKRYFRPANLFRACAGRMIGL